MQRSLPFHYGRTRSDRPVLFEGVPYASLKDDPFGVPFPIDYRQHGKAVNSPRFSSLSFFFGSSATCAVQSPKVFVLDSPLTCRLPQLLLAKFKRGYLGDPLECLQLNIWAPRDAIPQTSNSKAGLPVLVFFHGGAFIFGSSHQSIHNGRGLAEKGVIVVSCNYRLGFYGYLRIPGKPSNRGLRDQIEALRWVKQHIGAFGGDPNNVTLSGQSAGAMSVGCLLGVDLCYEERLFHKAIMISGTAHHICTEGAARRLFCHAAQGAGMSPEIFQKYLTGRASSVSPRQLAELQATIEIKNATAYNAHLTEHFLPFQPHVDASFDNSLLPIHPVLAVEARAKSRPETLVPLLIGFTDAEYTFFTRTIRQLPCTRALDGQSVRLRVRQWVHRIFAIPVASSAEGEAPFNPNTNTEANFDAFFKVLNSAYEVGDISSRVGPPHANYVAINGDYMFRLPSLYLADVYGSATNKTGVCEEDHRHCHAAGRGGSNCWVYRFDRPAPIVKLGATHALDLHYIFNTWSCLPHYTGGWSADVQRVSDSMGAEFAVFISNKLHQSSLVPSLELRLPLDREMPWPQWSSTEKPIRLYGTLSPDYNTTMTAKQQDEVEREGWGDTFVKCIRCDD